VVTGTGYVICHSRCTQIVYGFGVHDVVDDDPTKPIVDEVGAPAKYRKPAER